MENFRSKSYRDGRMIPEKYYGNKPGPPTGMHDLRSYSTNSYGLSKLQPPPPPPPPQLVGKEVVNMKKAKGNKVIGPSSSSKNWSLISDPELQRKKRVASYKAYGVEGKMKDSFKKSFRWVKDTCSQVVYGWW